MDKYLRESAWLFIMTQGICSLPIDSKNIALKNGWLCITYIELSERIRKSVEEIIQKYEKDGFVFWSKEERTFVICYNSAMPPYVYNWTIMHEIAHIYLKHVTPQRRILNRVRVPERTLFEKEAQGFVRRVLCPSIVLHDCKAYTVEDIRNLCFISREAAENRSNYMAVLLERNMWRASPLEVDVGRQFQPFINNYLRNKRKGFNLEIAAELFPFAA